MEKLILKYLNDSLSDEELHQLNQWLEIPGNQSEFEAYIRHERDVRLIARPDQSAEAYEKLRQRIEDHRPRLILPAWWKYAAAVWIVLILAMGYLYQSGYFNSAPLLIPGDEDITIEWADGRVEILNPDQTMNIRNIELPVSDDMESVSPSPETEISPSELAYNTIRVPYGKKFHIALSDGTDVNLQSGTSLRFPTRFSLDGIRQVFLEGEAYFQVANNPAIPFVVTTDQLKVEVTGTAFNVSAYPEDIYIDVVLEEGGVKLYSDGITMGEATPLTPGYIGSLDRRDNTISTQKVNTRIYTNWLEGKLTFRNMSFDNILRKLERHYDIRMVNLDEKLGQEIFNASFDKDETIENVLGFFNESYKIEFTITNNTVVIQ